MQAPGTTAQKKVAPWTLKTDCSPHCTRKFVETTKRIHTARPQWKAETDDLIGQTDQRHERKRAAACRRMQEVGFIFGRGKPKDVACLTLTPCLYGLVQDVGLGWGPESVYCYLPCTSRAKLILLTSHLSSSNSLEWRMQIVMYTTCSIRAVLSLSPKPPHPAPSRTQAQTPSQPLASS